jgi:hypothetical protein
VIQGIDHEEAENKVNQEDDDVEGNQEPFGEGNSIVKIFRFHCSSHFLNLFLGAFLDVVSEYDENDGENNPKVAKEGDKPSVLKLLVVSLWRKLD